jgi:hypothetical protein
LPLREEEIPEVNKVALVHDRCPHPRIAVNAKPQSPKLYREWCAATGSFSVETQPANRLDDLLAQARPAARRRFAAPLRAVPQTRESAQPYHAWE